MQTDPPTWQIDGLLCYRDEDGEVLCIALNRETVETSDTAPDQLEQALVELGYVQVSPGQWARSPTAL